MTKWMSKSVIYQLKMVIKLRSIAIYIIYNLMQFGLKLGYYKDGTTPYLPATTGRRLRPLGFISCYWKDAMTPYLPATTGRRLQPPNKRVAFSSASQPPSYDNLISDCSSTDLSIKCLETLIRRFKFFFIYPQTYLFIQQSHIFIVTLHRQIH